MEKHESPMLNIGYIQEKITNALAEASKNQIDVLDTNASDELCKHLCLIPGMHQEDAILLMQLLFEPRVKVDQAKNWFEQEYNLARPFIYDQVQAIKVRVCSQALAALQGKVMDHDHVHDVFLDAIKTWGEIVQLDIAVEECSELIKAIMKFKRKVMTNNPCDKEVKNIIEEVADVSIMIEQIKRMRCGNESGPIMQEKIEVAIKDKIERLKERLQQEDRL